jgi:hypothetical protein
MYQISKVTQFVSHKFIIKSLNLKTNFEIIYMKMLLIYKNVSTFRCPIVYVVVIKLPKHRRTEYKNNNNPNTV